VAGQLGVRTETVANWERELERPLARHHGAIIQFLGFDPAPAPQTLPERLRSIRLRLGLTQEEMGRKLGFDEWCVNRWEAGARKPSRWMATRLAGLLDAIERGDVVNPPGSDLRYFDLTRWSRRPPTGVLAVQPVTLGERIRHARLSQGMSQAVAARSLGVTRGTLYLWESDARRIGSGRMTAIIRFLKPRVRAPRQ
jgi:DNA-binding transcriptional regulator YiaG